MGKKRKFDSIRLLNRGIDKGYKALDRALAPRKSSRPRGRSMFDHFMDGATFSPKRRR